MWEGIANGLKIAGACVGGCVAIGSGYLAVGGPVPATKAYVIAQNEQLKSRLIENSIQTNKLQLDLLRKEKVDREIQIQTETNSSVKSIYMDRLNRVNDGISDTVEQNRKLQEERSAIR